jgi:type IV pilus assembly protein PilA
MKMLRKDEGFTLVELMVVVLIIGILVAIAVPVFLNASANAAAKSCQANQRTITGAISTYNASAGTAIALTTPEVLGAASGSTAINVLVPTSIRTAPTCPTTNKEYTVAADLTVGSDKALTTLAGDATDWSLATHQLGYVAP